MTNSSKATICIRTSESVRSRFDRFAGALNLTNEQALVHLMDLQGAVELGAGARGTGDDPDASLHAYVRRETMDMFKRAAVESGMTHSQFLSALLDRYELGGG